MSKTSNLLPPGLFFQAPNAEKMLCPRPIWGAYDAPPDPQVGWEGEAPSLYPSLWPRHLSRRDSRTQIPAYVHNIVFALIAEYSIYI